MNKEQEILEISKLVFRLTQVGSTGADLDDLLHRLFGVLNNLSALRVKPKAAILLFSSRQVLIQVAQLGLREAGSTLPFGAETEGIRPNFRAEVFVTSLGAEKSGLPVGRADEHFLVLPLTEDDRRLGQAFIFIEDNWPPDPVELEFMTDLAGALSSLVTRCLINETLQVREIELEEARADAIRRLGAASEYRDNETGMHIMRMTHFAGAVAKAMGLPDAEREMLLITAPMHDVGKIGVADAILLKPGRLTPDEFDIMKEHTLIGGGLLKGNDALIVAAREIAISHHEHWDGSGYPNGLKEQEIPLPARICSVADVFDALTSSRPYKEAWSVQKAIDWIHQESGRKFDPAVVAAFDLALPEILRIRELYREDIIDPNQILELPPHEVRETDYFVWNDSLNIGIDVIDTHHRYLVDLINDLHDVISMKQGSRQVARVLKALGEYAQVHFRAEENMMEHYGYTGIAGQKDSHRSFENKVKEFQDELHVNPLTAQFEMLTYLRDWLINHIQYEDTKLRELLVQV